MRFSKGDKVKFIDEVGGGEVVKVIDDATVLLLDETGFEYEVEADRLMLVKHAVVRQKQHNSTNHNSKNTGPQKKPAPAIKSRISGEVNLLSIKENTILRYGNPNIFLAFVPQNNNILIADIDLYLVNDSNYKLYYQIAVKKENVFTTIDDGILEAGTQVKFLSPVKKDLLKLKEISVRGILVLPAFIKEGKPFEEIIKVKPVKFTKEGSFKKNDYFETNSIIIPVKILHNKVEFASSDQKYSATHNTTKLKGVFTTEKVEIDLHIEELTKDYRNLTPGEMIDIQINHFIKTLEKALISEKVKYLVVVHGVGNGILKTKIRSILREDYPKLKFGDAPFDEYGFGATLIKIK